MKEGHLSIAEFVKQWNEDGGHAVKYCLVQGEGVILPSTIEARFPPRNQAYEPGAFWEFMEEVERKSHHAMYVVDDERLFYRGILDLKVNPSVPCRCETAIENVLKWIEEVVKK